LKAGGIVIESHTNLTLRRRAPVGLRAVAFRAFRLLSALLVVNVALGAGGVVEWHGLAARRDAVQGEAQAPAPCEVGKRQMKPGETHACMLKLAAKQFARVVVAQQGVDVGIRLSAPDGTVVAEMDSPNGLFGLEAVSVVAASEGDYKVEVYSYSTTPPGDYELRVEGPRESNAADERRVIAERVFVEAQVLRFKAAAKPCAQGPEQYNPAIEKYKEALPIWRELGDLRGEGYTLYGIGRSYKALGQLQPALDYMGQARERLREAQDVSGQAFVLNETGAAQRDLGDALRAIDSYGPALELRISNNDLWGKAQLYNNIGLTYSNVGFQPKAIQNFEKALTIWRGMKQRRLEMTTLINAAKAYVEMGELDAAFERYGEVLKFCDTEDNATQLKPFALNGLGLVYDTWADSEQARANYQQALELFRKANNPRGEADVLDNLGMAHAFLGDATKALEYFRAALAIRECLNEPKGWAMTLSNIGYAETLLGDNQEALKNLALALPLSEKSNDRRFEAYTLMRVGVAYVSAGDPRKALDAYGRALAIQTGAEFKDLRGQALTLDKMGEALALSGEATEALGKYERALVLWKAVGDRQGQALSLYGVARVELGRNNLANARDRIEEAIDIVESLRYKVSGRQLRMTYFAGKQDFYALDIEARTRLYELTHSDADMEAALWASERARARSLIDLLSEARTSPRKGMTEAEAEASRRREDKISELTQTFFRLRSVGENEEEAAIERKLAAYISEQDELPARDAKASAEAGRDRPLTPREVQQLLDPDTMLLQYSLGEERSHLWVVTRTEIEHHFLTGRAEIKRVAEQLRQALTAYEPRRPEEEVEQYLKRLRDAPDLYQRSALELSRMVLGSVSTRLGNKRLVVVADGVLQYIPFEALPLPGAAASEGPTSAAPVPAVLLSQNEVVYQPSASTLALLRGARPRPRGAFKTIAVIADPVFSEKDDRLRPPAAGRGPATPSRAPNEKPSDSSEKLSRSLRDLGDLGNGEFTLPKLEYSLKEAKDITAAARSGSWMKPATFVGFKANRATAMSPALKRFDIVHFATHGILNDKHPELSGIVLSMFNERGEPEDGYLTLHDIYNLDLPVDLVVLSACRTGIGKEVRGEGLLGLTRGFMYAGASRVVASLWRMDDEASAELMKRFYQHMLEKKRMPASAALRKAKLEMMETGGEWRAPFYWAGFVLQGDWK
jgi:CHAT domain-containing protein/Flp pilus assembly protein TadD